MNKNPISEIASLTELDRLMRCRERIEEMHMENMDYTAAIADKWAMASLAQRGI